MGKKKLVPAADIIDSVVYEKLDVGIRGKKKIIALYDDGELMAVPSLFLASQDSFRSAETYASALKSLFNEIKKRNPGDTWRDINQAKIDGWLISAHPETYNVLKYKDIFS